MTEPQPVQPANTANRSVALDVNAVVSYNVKAIRERRGWTQQSVAERLGRVTGHQLPQASISAMERAFDGARRRCFDAHELYLLSVVFDVPIAAAQRRINHARIPQCRPICRGETLDGAGPAFAEADMNEDHSCASSSWIIGRGFAVAGLT